MPRRAIIAGLLLLAACATAPPDGSGTPEARVARLLRQTPLVDGHNDLVIHFHACRAGCPRGLDAYDITADAAGQTDIARWREGGLGAQLLNSGWRRDEPGLDGTLKGLAFVRELVARHPRDLVLARTSEEVRRAHAAGRIAILLALENPGRLGATEAEVRRLAAEGVRANLLAYDGPSEFADGHEGPAAHGGLSERGRDMVAWMQRHGMLVDLSHASADTMRDVLDVATAPVLFSHSNAAALCDVPRNVPDDVLRRLAANGGIAMATFVPYFTARRFADWMAEGDAYWQQLAREHDGNRAFMDPLMDRWEREHPAPAVTVADVADHVEHIRDVAGIDHVGIGGDFDGIAFTVAGLDDVSTYPRLLEELARRGWSDVDLAKLAGENFLRVLDQADAAAAKRRASARTGQQTGIERRYDDARESSEAPPQSALAEE
jgi:membrane dipeptidase